MISNTIALWREIADAVGMLGFAVAGLIACEGRRIDPVGVFVAVFTTAFGGGILRDLMLDLRPFYWMSHTEWIWATLALTVFARGFLGHIKKHHLQSLYNFVDAVGLAFFSVGSCATALTLGQAGIVSVLIGVATGVFGGLMRDVFCDRLPAVLSDKRPYAAAAFIGCSAYVLFARLPLEGFTELWLWLCCAMVIGIRFLGIKWKSLRIAYADQREDEASPLTSRTPSESGESSKTSEEASKSAGR